MTIAKLADIGLLLDLDGTLYIGESPLPGAVEAVAALRRAGIPLRFLTNTTRRSRAALGEWLRRRGFDIPDEELFTAPAAAAQWLSARGIRRIGLYLPETTHADFLDFDIADEDVEAVVVGDLGEQWSFATMNRAFRQLLGGARLVALQRNRYWRTEEGWTLDAGAFVAALEYAAGCEAVTVGKPSAEFFHLGAAALGMSPHRILVVGDDLETDIAGAHDAGLRSVLVRTGKFRGENLAGEHHVPFAILDSIADLPALLNRRGD